MLTSLKEIAETTHFRWQEMALLLISVAFIPKNSNLSVKIVTTNFLGSTANLYGAMIYSLAIMTSLFHSSVKMVLCDLFSRLHTLRMILLVEQ